MRTEIIHVHIRLRNQRFYLRNVSSSNWFSGTSSLIHPSIHPLVVCITRDRLRWVLDGEETDGTAISVRRCNTATMWNDRVLQLWSALEDLIRRHRPVKGGHVITYSQGKRENGLHLFYFVKFTIFIFQLKSVSSMKVATFPRPFPKGVFDQNDRINHKTRTLIRSFQHLRHLKCFWFK